MTDAQAKSTNAFAELGRIRYRETDLATALARVAELARRTIPGADDVSITLVGPGGPRTASFTGPCAMTLDEWQYQQGNGPCLAAAVANFVVTIPDMAGESRWPGWANHAIDLGVHSSVSIGLPLHESVSGAVNVYAGEPYAFDEDAVRLAGAFGGYAAVAMANAHRYDRALPLAPHTRVTTDSRAVIEQAKGIIMSERRCRPDEAFRILAKLAEYSGRELHDAAAVLVAGITGTAQR